MRKILFALLLSCLLISCSNEGVKPEERETTFSFSLSGETSVDEVIIDDIRQNAPDNFTFTMRTDGFPIMFTFLKDGILIAQKEVEGYKDGGMNSYTVDPDDFKIHDLLAYEIGGIVYASWKSVEAATSYAVNHGSKEEVITEYNAIELEGREGDEITVVPLFSSFRGEECSTIVKDGRNDIHITVNPPSIDGDIPIEISEEDITLEYGGSISFYLSLEGEAYDDIWWTLNRKEIGHGMSITIDWDNSALRLGGKEESLTLHLEKMGKEYSKTITFVCK